MKVSALFLATLGAASAFVPAPLKLSGSVTSSRSQKLYMNFAGGLLGSDVEFKDFDPLGLSKGKDDETLAYYRAAELKHGRVCMLAAVGYFVQGLYQLPDAPFSNPKPVDALIKVATERPLAAVQIGIAIAALEVLGASIQRETAPGDLKFDPFNLKPEDEGEFAALQLKELKNGRLAMVSVAGLAVQEYVTGQGIVDQLKSLF